MYQMLRERCEWLSNDAIQFASRLINVPSLSLKEEKAADIVENEMRKLGYDKIIRDGAGNIIGILYGREQSPNILLSSHLDTVPVQEDEKWQQPPYSGTIYEGKVFGRGASDCKGGIAAQVYAGALLKRSLLPMTGNIIVAAVVAEENGLSLGTHYLMSETLPGLALHPDFAILGEPTDLGIYYGHDGWMEINIELESPNAFEVEDAMEVVANEMEENNSGNEMLRFDADRDYYKTHDNNKRSILSLRNRLYNGEQPEHIVERVEKMAAAASKSVGKVSVNAFIKKENQEFYTGKSAPVQYFAKAWETDPFHPMIERARQSLTAAGCGFKIGKWKLGKIGMGTSGGVLLNEYKIPIICYGPGSEAMAHETDEYVEIDKLKESIYGTAVMVNGIAGIPVYGWTIDEI